MPLVAINRFAWNTIIEERPQAVIDADGHPTPVALAMVEVCKIENKACKIGAFQMGPDFCPHSRAITRYHSYCPTNTRAYAWPSGLTSSLGDGPRLMSDPSTPHMYSA